MMALAPWPATVSPLPAMFRFLARRTRPAHVPPGPHGSWLLDNLVEYEQDRTGFLLRAAREYGDVVRFNDNVYLVNHPELIGEIFSATNKRFSKTQNFLRERETPRSLNAWMQARKAAINSMGKDLIASFGDRISASAEDLVQSWHPGQRLAIQSEMESVTSRLIAKFCFGDQGAEIPALCGELLETLFPIVSNPYKWPLWVPVRHNREEWKAERAVNRAVDAVIVERKRRGEPDAPDLLSAVMRPLAKFPLSGLLLRRIMISVLLAAHGVPAAAMAWIWHLLASRPRAYDKLQAELDAVLAGRTPTVADLPNLPYLKGVVKETLRLYPATWLLARKAAVDTEIGGYTLPKGHGLIFSSFIVGRDPRWYQHPQAFLPERWLDDDWVKSLPTYAYFPFGGGPRVCLGQTFGMTELLLLTATIAQRVRFEVPAGVQVRLDCRRSLQPAGLEVIAHRRSPNAAARPADAA